jgi:hypothetical protein
MFKKLFSKVRVGSFFGASAYELEHFMCGIGEAVIADTTITIRNYPFEPSLVFPEKVISVNELDAISWNSYPPLLKIGKEVIFISREKSEELRMFAERNGVQIFEGSLSWDWLLEPYLDTEYTNEIHERVMQRLQENGIEKQEVERIRREVGDQMNKYNFDTMLWEWGRLGLMDVLCAMRVKYTKKEFADFYHRAMEIQLRSK